MKDLINFIETLVAQGFLITKFSHIVRPQTGYNIYEGGLCYTHPYLGELEHSFKVRVQGIPSTEIDKIMARQTEQLQKEFEAKQANKDKTL